MFAAMFVLWFVSAFLAQASRPGQPRLDDAGRGQAITADAGRRQPGGQGGPARVGRVRPVRGHHHRHVDGLGQLLPRQHDPGGGAVPLVNIMLGEVSPGGVGAGLYGMLIFAMLSVFIAGLMVGRTPEYLGKKIQAQEMKLVVLYILAVPLAVLGFTACLGPARLGRARRS